MRKLATIDTVKNIAPIDGADLIELATIRGWNVVIKKDEFQIGDKVIYCEIDSWIPKEIAPFLSHDDAKPYKGIFGGRLRTKKIRGVFSQGLVLNPKEFGVDSLEVGSDVSEQLGIIKWECDNIGGLAGDIKGDFPIFIRKTDQERLQNIETIPNSSYTITEKLEGSSMTIYRKDGVFGVCSRNIDLKLEQTGNMFVNKFKNVYDKEFEKSWIELENRIGEFALQGELVGEKIQGNLYEIKGMEFYVFGLWSVNNQSLIHFHQMVELVEQYFPKLKIVPIVDSDYRVDDPNFNLDEFMALANMKSNINPSKIAEGIVCYTNDTAKPFSFKVINNNYLLKQK